MAQFAIFPLDTAGARVQHISDSVDADAAFAEFAQIVGDHATRGDFAIIEMTESETAQIKQWIDNGEPADKAPKWLDELISRSTERG